MGKVPSKHLVVNPHIVFCPIGQPLIDLRRREAVQISKNSLHLFDAVLSKVELSMKLIRRENHGILSVRLHDI